MWNRQGLVLRGARLLLDRFGPLVCNERSLRRHYQKLSGRRKRRTQHIPWSSASSFAYRQFISSTTATPTKDHDDTAATSLFSDLENMDRRIQKALAHRGFTRRTEIQKATWDPIVHQQLNVIALARTGTGKTLAFATAALQRILDASSSSTTDSNTSVRVLILAPTRELTQQIHAEIQSLLSTRYFQNDDEDSSSLTNHDEDGSPIIISSYAMYGGTPKYKDMTAFRDAVPHILVSSPGRLLDHLQGESMVDKKDNKNNPQPFSSCFDDLDMIVLDEFDMLLDLGFRPAIQRILALLPAAQKQPRQMLVFSATMPPKAHAMVKSLIAQNTTYDEDDKDKNNEPVLIDCVSSSQSENDDQSTSSSTPTQIEQSLVILPEDKAIWGTIHLLLRLMKQENSSITSHKKILVFFSTKAQVTLFARLFNHHLGIRVWELHADIPAARRAMVSDLFRMSSQRQAAVLFSSDVSSRGMDYPGITHVVQVGVPSDRSVYIHRLGRTGRNRESGQSILILTEPESIFVEHELQEFIPSLQRNDSLEVIANTLPLDPFVDEVRRSIRASLRDQDDRALTESVVALYTSLVGYYIQFFRRMKVPHAEQDALDYVSSLLVQLGHAHLPAVSLADARSWGLVVGNKKKRSGDTTHQASSLSGDASVRIPYENVNIRETWSRGRSFQVGAHHNHNDDADPDDPRPEET